MKDRLTAWRCKTCRHFRLACMVSLVFASCCTFCGFPGALVACRWGPRHQSQHGKLAAGLQESIAAYEDVFEVTSSVMISVACLLYALKPVSSAKAEKEEMIESAAEAFLQPFKPERPQDEVVEREVTKTLGRRFKEWKGHPTYISGRHGSGKTWAWQEALREVTGVAVIPVHNEQKSVTAAVEGHLGINLSDLKKLLERVRREISHRPSNLTKVPVIVLEVYSVNRTLAENVCCFAKELSSDSSLAHVLVCDSSFVSALSQSRDFQGVHLWVEDFSLSEATDALAKKGHVEDAGRYIDTYGCRALDLAKACDEDLGDWESLQSQEVAHQVERFCDFVIESPAGSGLLQWVGYQLFNGLLEKKREGDPTGISQDFLQKGFICPHEVVAWIEENAAQAVVWKPSDQRYHFASELHYRALEERLERIGAKLLLLR